MISAASKWPAIIRYTRVDLEPYTVVTITNDKFSDWTQIQKTIISITMNDTSKQLLR